MIVKNKKIWYLGYVIAFISLLALFIVKDNKILERVLPFIFSVSISISFVMTMHNKKMEKDPSYRISINDERNEKIRDMLNAAVTPVFILIMGLVAVICFSIEAVLPAIILALGVFSYPVITFFVSHYYEKKY